MIIVQSHTDLLAGWNRELIIQLLSGLKEFSKITIVYVPSTNRISPKVKPPPQSINPCIENFIESELEG
jgi:hypothetical protein